MPSGNWGEQGALSALMVGGIGIRVTESTAEGFDRVHPASLTARPLSREWVAC